MNNVSRGTLFNDQCVFYLLDGTKLIQEIKDQRTYSNTAIAALGRSTMISAIIGLQGKDDTKISTIINGGGSIGSIIVTANAQGEIKAKVTNPEADASKLSETKLNVGKIVGTNGSLNVSKDLGLKEPFNSSVALQTGEIAEDYAYYFTVSEQIPTAIAAGVLINKDRSIKNASCFLVQLLPNASQEAITKLENFFTKNTHITSMMGDVSHESFLETHFQNEYQILKQSTVKFKCTCSKEKFVSGLKLLEPKDIIDIKKDKTIECICDFCQTKYNIATEEI